MACIYKINGKTFNTTEEIQNYVSSDEFVSVLAKGNSGISKEIRNLILNEEVTEGGVKAPQVTEGKPIAEQTQEKEQEATPQVTEANVKAIEEAMTKKSGTIKNEIIKEAANPTEVKKILDNLDAIKSKLAGFTTKDGDRIFSEECKWG
jgi:hypothetical protein